MTTATHLHPNLRSFGPHSPMVKTGDSVKQAGALLDRDIPSWDDIPRRGDRSTKPNSTLGDFIKPPRVD